MLIYGARWSQGHGDAEAYRRIAGPGELEHLRRKPPRSNIHPSGSLDRPDTIPKMMIISFGEGNIDDSSGYGHPGTAKINRSSFAVRQAMAEGLASEG